ncbi:MAG TPA: hypothetical protein VLD62_10100, partial [Acidimicrobiia bacterium]|nr:hypothetical protein [Acidimicrobiia bacterium]
MSEGEVGGRGIPSALAHEWREIGGLGRLALVGVLAAAVLSVVLGFSITNVARGHLLEARAEILAAIVADLPDPSLGVGAPGYAAFDAEVTERLLGGETVQVKLWRADGVVAYSDDPGTIGRRFDLTEPALRAFSGELTTVVSDLDDPAHADHRHLESLIEFYVPVLSSSGSVEAVFEIEQQTDRLEAALGRIERDVWLSIGGGLAVVGLFLGALALARARDLNRRRRQAEELLRSLVHVQDEERRRIIGALHDDIGQPLYRILFGLEGSAARLDADDPVRGELAGLAGLVRDVDGILRGELKTLHAGLLADLELGDALRALARTVEDESGLRIDVLVETSTGRLDEVRRTALFRAASEALTNARKHADASSAKVTVRTNGRLVTLEVVDDGIGGTVEPGLGLTT